MINAKIHSHFGEGSAMLIEFSDEFGVFHEAPKNLVAVDNEADLFRRLYFKNRMYICDTLCSWLNQRKHAMPSAFQTIEKLMYKVNVMRKLSYPEICNIVLANEGHFMEIAPSSTSTCNKHFQKVIAPILQECINVSTGKANVHYC